MDGTERETGPLNELFPPNVETTLLTYNAED